MGAVPPSYFQPPPPYSIDGYLDTVTNGLLQGIEPQSIYSIAARVDGALKIIDQRPTAERLALRQAVVNRLAAYGEAKGWLRERETQSDAEVLEKIILEKVFGLKKTSVEEKVVKQFKAQLKSSIKAGLNSKGQAYFKFLGFINDLVSAKSAEEAALVLMKESTTGLGAWVNANGGKSFVVSRLKFIGVSSKARSQILKWISIATAKAAPAMKFGSKICRFFARLNVYITLADLVLTPEEIASDEVEQKLTWLFILERARFVSSQPLFDSLDKQGSLSARDVLRRFDLGPSGGGPSIGAGSASGRSGPSATPVGGLP